MSKKLETSGKGVSEKGEGVGRKGIACSQSQTFYRAPFAHERRAIVQFHWLVARQSKSDIRHPCIIRHPGHNKIKIHMAESEEELEFSVQQTLKDLSQNGKHIDLKPEQEAAIRV